MIPTKTQTLDVTSTLEGKEIGMTIDENSLVHIMQVLTDLYSDPLLAIVREYSTNARDAHIAAGKADVPIEVYTPNTLSPSLRIVDHGVGLSADDIEQIYSKYGASTKTDSNDFNGVLGLGCKSALTYTSQFTVVGTKDGVRTTVSVSRDEEGVGTMTLLDEVEVDADNGVEIQIAIKQGDRLNVREKAEEFFRYWKPGTVLLDTKPPEHVTGMQIGEHIILEKMDHYDFKHLLVMGGVAYPLENPNFDSEMSFDLPSGYRIIAEVPIGAVHFTPSREALNYTNRTKDVIKQLVTTFKADLADAVTKEIDAQTTKHDAIKVAVRWVSVLPTALRQAKFMYKGVELPSQIKPEVDGTHWIVSDGKDNKDWYGKRTGVGKHGRVSSITISQIDGCLFVSGFNRTFTPTVKHKLWEWCDQQNREYPVSFVMTGDKPSSPWIDPSQIISWPDDVEPIKLPRYQNRTYVKNGKPTRLKGSYDLYEGTGDGTYAQKLEVPADDIDTSGKTIYYCNTHSAYAYAKLLSHLFDDWILVYFIDRRQDKFMRLFPNAAQPMPIIREACDWIWSQFTDFEKQIIAYHSEYRNRNAYGWLSWVTKDPEIRHVLRLRDYDPERVERLTAAYKLIRGYGSQDYELPTIANPLERYPLTKNAYYYARGRGSVEAKHMLLYMNMIYEMERSTNA